ncbi:hypothetical protein CF326_g6367 [Tilletia indica]|nr:hypothetical protein CF326_g6367 [Tilletia indica]
MGIALYDYDSGRTTQRMRHRFTSLLGWSSTTVPALFSFEVEEDSSQEVTRKVGFAMPETSTFRTLLEWAQYEFNLDQDSFYLCHGNHVLLAHEVLNETGLSKNFHIFFRQNGDRLLRLPASRFRTLHDVFRPPKILTSTESASIMMEIESTSVRGYSSSTSMRGVRCELDILVSRHGGGGARARIGPFSRSRATPAEDDAASSTWTSTVDMEADDTPPSLSSEALAFQEDIEGFESLLGQGHGIIRGLWTLLPPPSTGNVRLSLVGPRIRRWSIMLGPVTPLRTVVTYLERIYGQRFRYLHQGVPLDRLSTTPWGADLVDGSLIEVFEEQVGGSHRHPRPPSRDKVNWWTC